MNNSRALFVLIISTLVFIFLVINLVRIQVVEHEKYIKVAIQQQKKSKFLNAQRGIITDRNNDVLVYSKDDITIIVDNRMTDDTVNEYRVTASFFKNYGCAITFILKKGRTYY